MFSRICLGLTLLVGVLSIGPVVAETSKASGWIGRVVVTTEGELLGRIEDFALDIEGNRIEFVVVSIGSFLIDNNLIAVHPAAIGPSDDGRYLVLYSDKLDSARRFGADSWPAQADVQPSAERVPVEIAELDEQDKGAGFSADRVATISDGRRTATMKAGERNAQIETTATAPPPTGVAGIAPKRFQERGADPILADSEFDGLDEDGDGYLSRREIGARFSRTARYQDYDLDGNDGIDRFEFQILKDPS